MSKQRKNQATTVANKKPRKIGAPITVTEAMYTAVLQRLAAGETLIAICRDPGTPHRSTVLQHRAENSAFADRYAQARLQQMDTWADETIAIADDGTTDYIKKVGRNGVEYEAVDQEHIQRSRLRVDTRMRLMALIAPLAYGERVQHDHTGEVAVTVDITDRERMRRMALFMLEDQKAGATIDGELAATPTIA